MTITELFMKLGYAIGVLEGLQATCDLNGRQDAGVCRAVSGLDSITIEKLQEAMKEVNP